MNSLTFEEKHGKLDTDKTRGNNKICPFLTMADELTPEMLQEAQPDLLTLEDEDGKECTFEVIDATEVNGTRYLAVIPYQEDPESLDEEAELILMRIGTDEAGEYMDIVDDDEELLTVGKVFEERLRAMYDIDDDDVEGQPS